MKYAPVPPLKVGDVVTFVNKDLFRHSVTASNNSFDLDLVPGARSEPSHQLGRACSIPLQVSSGDAWEHDRQMSSRSLALDYASMSDMELAGCCAAGDVEAVGSSSARTTSACSAPPGAS